MLSAALKPYWSQRYSKLDATAELAAVAATLAPSPVAAEAAELDENLSSAARFSNAAMRLVSELVSWTSASMRNPLAAHPAHVNPGGPASMPRVDNARMGGDDVAAALAATAALAAVGGDHEGCCGAAALAAVGAG